MMSSTVIEAINDFSDELVSLYGDRLSSIVLYGSYARGDQEEESDIDLLLLLDQEKVDPYEEIPKITNVAYPIILKSGQWLSYLPFSLARWKKEDSYFIDNVRRDSVIVWKKRHVKL